MVLWEPSLKVQFILPLLGTSWKRVKEQGIVDREPPSLCPLTNECSARLVAPIFARPKVMAQGAKARYLGGCRQLEVGSRDENDVGVPVQLRRLICWLIRVVRVVRYAISRQGGSPALQTARIPASLR